jgi:hypothetical protein
MTTIIKKGKASWPQTIEDSLLAAWQSLRRRNDAKELVDETGFSYVSIIKALKYGHVKDYALESGITAFYAKRLKEHEKNGKPLSELGEMLLKR